MNAAELAKMLESEKIRKLFGELYGDSVTVYETQKKRYCDLLDDFTKRFGSPEGVRLFSSPGRSEIGGNHTDHNHGKVLAASIQLDCIGAAAPSADNKIHIKDFTYNEDYEVDLSELGDGNHVGPQKGSKALIRGICAGFKKNGFKTGGFSASFTSHVIPASGVSSSASFEMIIAYILNRFYNDGKIPLEKMAAAGQFAENVYWGKSSGLLDQMACGAGGLVAMDFEEPSSPVVEKIPFDFAAKKYRVVLVNTGGNHANLSDEYSAIPSEMKQVARFFGREVLRGISAEEIAGKLPEIRAACGDRAVLRAFHFEGENNRVAEEIAALKSNNFPLFLKHIGESGNSSWKWLQNIYVPSGRPLEQGLSIGLALTEIFIRKRGLDTGPQGPRAACRVHGGGFAGVIQAFLPEETVSAYEEWINRSMPNRGDKRAVFVMSIRPYGVIEVEA
ncbi:MAG: galactokinase [Treponema sp.]|jgi:galactokinase|nr:galactokinase [Treponema sp.]